MSQKHLFRMRKNSTDPKKVVSAWPQMRLEMAGIGTGGSAQQLQCAIVAVQPYPLHSAPSTSPTLGTAVASSGHCQPLEPRAHHARSRPKLTHPPNVDSSQKRAQTQLHHKRSKTIKHDQTRGPSKTIENDQQRSKNMFSPFPLPIARPPPATKMLL